MRRAKRVGLLLSATVVSALVLPPKQLRPARVAAAARLTEGCETFRWLDNDVRVCSTGPAYGQPVVMLHGFGSSLETWRAAAPALVDAGYRCHRMDLLGLGLSTKAAGPYSIDRWADQVEALLDDRARTPVLVGNSIGSLVSLAVAARRPVRGVLLVNCAGGMNSKFASKEEGLPGYVRAAAGVAGAVLDALLRFKPLASWLFDNVRSPETVKSVLRNVYVNAARVDDLIVDATLAPAADPGALGVFVEILTGDPGPTPRDLLPRVAAPVHVLWGSEDQITPLGGPTGALFRRAASEQRCTLTVVEAGHVPHDDVPEEATADMLAWLGALPG
mmetsp:Transcript_7814/g.23227  ORF Transcript_7814/g.23227 Transcript_7814/m.23227 type:complete len:332 (-) Transcript_7814:8-1003(-)